MGAAETKPLFPKVSKPILREIKEDPVVMYSKTSCGYCRMAKEVLDAEGVPFRERNLEAVARENPSQIENYMEGLVGVSHMRTVPQIFVCGRLVGGYTELASLRPNLRKMVEECSNEHKNSERSRI